MDILRTSRIIRELLLLAFGLLGWVPLFGIDSTLHAADKIHPSPFPDSSVIQFSQTSSHRDEPTIAQQFTAGSTNDNTTSPVGTTETQSTPNTNENSTKDEPKTPVELVAKYLKSSSVSEHSEIGKEIRKSNDISSVANAIRNASLWDKPKSKWEHFVVEMPPFQNVDVSYRLPAAYDGTKPTALVIQVPPVNWITKLGFQGETNFPDDKQITAHFSRPVGGSFHRMEETDGNLATLVYMTRRKLNVDSSRVFVEGLSEDDDPAWAVAVGYRHLFAGVVTPGYAFATPYRPQMYSLLFGNLSGLPVLTWDEWCNQSNPNGKAIGEIIGDEMEKIAKRFDVPIYFLPSFHSGPDYNPLKDKKLDPIRDNKREEVPPKLSHYFRYPEQGQCAWLRQTKFAGDVWTAEQLSILPGADADADQYITDVLKSLLAYMGGTIEGNTIRIETRRCAEIELLLYENMVDFTKPVVVYINGKKRHDRIVKPSIPTLLEEAYDTFDFQRLVFAKLAFDIKEDSTAPAGK